jgi:hypothetical protein
VRAVTLGLSTVTLAFPSRENPFCMASNSSVKRDRGKRFSRFIRGIQGSCSGTTNLGSVNWFQFN